MEASKEGRRLDEAPSWAACSSKQPLRQQLRQEERRQEAAAVEWAAQGMRKKLEPACERRDFHRSRGWKERREAEDSLQLLVIPPLPPLPRTFSPPPPTNRQSPTTQHQLDDARPRRRRTLSWTAPYPLRTPSRTRPRPGATESATRCAPAQQRPAPACCLPACIIMQWRMHHQQRGAAADDVEVANQNCLNKKGNMQL